MSTSFTTPGKVSTCLPPLTLGPAKEKFKLAIKPTEEEFALNAQIDVDLVAPSAFERMFLRDIMIAVKAKNPHMRYEDLIEGQDRLYAISWSPHIGSSPLVSTPATYWKFGISERGLFALRRSLRSFA